MTGTAVTTADPKPQLVVGGEVAAIIPRSIEEMFRLAGAISASRMAPQSLDTPEKVMVAIMAGAELGLAPFQSLQSFAVINNRPAIWGDGLMAVVRSQGFKVKEWTEGEGDAMVARCEVTRPDNGDVAIGEFSVADAKKANLWSKAGPWQQYPKRMLKMRARAFALRDGAADVLRGFQIREEVEDYPAQDPAPQSAGTGMRARLEARTATGGFDPEHVTAALDEVLEGDLIPDHHATTGEIIETTTSDDGQEPRHVVEGEREGAEASGGAVPPGSSVDGPPARDPSEDFPGDKPATTGPTLAEKVQAFKDRCCEAANLIKLRSIGNAAGPLRRELDAKDPDLLAEVDRWFEERVAMIEKAEREAGNA
jgi:hypothetical protein